VNRALLIKELNRLLSATLENKSAKNIAHFGRKVGISESTLRRLYNLQAIPSSANVIKFLSYLSGKNEISELIAAYPGVVADYLLSLSKIDEAKTAKHFSEQTSHDEIIHDYCSSLIVKWVCDFGHVTIKDITYLLGDFGKSVLHHLVQKKIMTINESGIITFSDQGFVPPQSQTKNPLIVQEGTFYRASPIPLSPFHEKNSLGND
jgi:hypothetical protein